MISKNFIYGLRALLSRLAIAWLAFFGLALLLGSAMATNITGAGASLPYPVYAKWAAKYHQLTGKQVNYQSIGSGGGQQQIIVEIGRASCRERVESSGADGA